MTLLMFVMMQPDVLELLVQAGGDLNAKTKNGETPLDICEGIYRLVFIASYVSLDAHSMSGMK